MGKNWRSNFTFFRFPPSCQFSTCGLTGEQVRISVRSEMETRFRKTFRWAFVTITRTKSLICNGIICIYVWILTFFCRPQNVLRRLEYRNLSFFADVKSSRFEKFHFICERHLWLRYRIWNFQVNWSKWENLLWDGAKWFKTHFQMTRFSSLIDGEMKWNSFFTSLKWSFLR